MLHNVNHIFFFIEIALRYADCFRFIYLNYIIYPPLFFNYYFFSAILLRYSLFFGHLSVIFRKKEDVPPVISLNNQRHIFFSNSLFLLIQKHLIHIPLPDSAVLRHKLHRFFLLDSL